ncbi:MAG: GGDEF domain-containing protein [Pseudobutyrivibrio sp.]|nr:GGDEF domain-containing protein [Pseudobutyrivibrio sp.]
MLKVGVVVGNISSDHSETLLRGIRDKAKDLDVKLYGFVGVHTSEYYRNINDAQISDENFNYQCNVIYDYSRFCKLDAVIVSCGTISPFLEGTSLDEFLERFRGIKMVLVEEESEDEDVSSIITNNYEGEYNITEYLIKEKGCKDIVVIRGPIGNRDAEDRLRAVRDCMEANGLSLDASRLEVGDFSQAVANQLQALFDRHPNCDAIICANDMMAQTAYSIAERNGRVVGQDINIVGYDDSFICNRMLPTMTSVKQSVYEMGARALEMAVDLNETGKGVHETMPGKPVYRGSTGDKDVKDVEYFHKVVSGLSEVLNGLRKDIWFISTISASMVGNVDNETRFYDTMLDKLEKLGCTSAWVLLLKNPIRRERIDTWECPKELKLAVRMVNGQREIYTNGKWPIISRESAKTDGNMVMYQDEKDVLVKFAYPMFHEKMQYGIMVIDAPVDRLFTMQLALEQIDSAMSFYTLHQSLKEKNQILENLSTKDGLTGIYNRRGFTELMLHKIVSNPGQRMRLIMADLDHLKQINDSFGHNEGDYAIISTAKILKETFPNGEIIGRIGGDEFAILVTDSSDESFEQQRTRLVNNYTNFNLTLGKGYYVECSVGAVDFTGGTSTGISNIFELADGELYASKRERRTSAVRQ